MASSEGVVGFMVVVAALLHFTTAATNYTVGDSSGWTIPSPNTLYTSWINNKVFTVGDNLIFTFTTEQHDVLQVPKERYDSCSGTAAIGSSITTGPATVTLTSAGQHYFICTVGTHCSLGQKLAITVVSSSTIAPSPTTRASPTPSPTPSPTTRASPTPSPTPSGRSPPTVPSGANPPSPSPSPSPSASGLPPPSSPSPTIPASPTPSSSPSGRSPPTVPSGANPSLSPPSTGGPPSPSSATSLAAGFRVATVLSAISFFL